MGRMRTFVLGPGVLICPNGEKFNVTELTIEQPDDLKLFDGKGQVIQEKPPKDRTVTITLKE